MSEQKQVERFNAAVLMNLPEMTPGQRQKWIGKPLMLQKVLDKALCSIGDGMEEAARAIPFHRHCFSFTVPATAGKRTFVSERNLFRGFLDPHFTSYGLDKPGKPKLETRFEMLELLGVGVFNRCISSLGVGLDELVSTQDQVIWVVESYLRLIGLVGAPVWFVLKGADEYYVVRVDWISDASQCQACVSLLDRAVIFDTADSGWLVIPKLKPAETARIDATA